MELSQLNFNFSSFSSPNTFIMSFSLNKILLNDLRLKEPNPLRRLNNIQRINSASLIILI